MAVAVLLIFPLIGFSVSAFSSGLRVSWQWLRPLAIVTLLAFWDVLVPIHVYELRHVTIATAFHAAGFSEAFAEAGRAVVVTLFLLWSIGVIRIRRSPGQAPIGDTVTV